MTIDTDEKYYKIICQEWEESERGWGVRPDGASLHIDPLEWKNDIDRYWDEEKKRNGDRIPSIYTREAGKPKVVEVTAEVYASIIEAGGKSQFIHELTYRELIAEGKIRMVA